MKKKVSVTYPWPLGNLLPAGEVEYGDGVFCEGDDVDEDVVPMTLTPPTPPMDADEAEDGMAAGS